jgi:hypothetical protein
MATSITAHGRRGPVELSVRRRDIDDVHEADLSEQIPLPRHERYCLFRAHVRRHDCDLELVSFAVSKTASPTAREKETRYRRG